MNVFLINPSYWTGNKKPLGYFSLSSLPLGLCYIAAALKLRGIPSRVLDMNITETSIDQLKEKLDQSKPDVVGITCFTSNYSNAVCVAKAVKAWNPKAFVVLGGVHATFMHTEILESVPEVDAVVCNEGEVTMCEIAEALEAGTAFSEINGLTYREGSAIQSTPPRNRLEDLDELPYPAFDLLEPSVEDYIKLYGVRNFPIITTRGCPFECVFCSTSAFHGRKYRTRKVNSIVDEIQYLIGKYKIENISFVDDNFTMQKDRVVDLCNELKKRGVSIKWGCSSRVDQLPEDLIKTMAEAGCNSIFFGVESASQPVLDFIKKGFSVKQAQETVKLCEKLGVRTHVSFIIGLPGENTESLEEMLSFIDETKPSGRVLPNVLDILPGTDLYSRTSYYFPGKALLEDADITKSQVEMLLKFYQINFKVQELFRVTPPNIAVEY